MTDYKIPLTRGLFAIVDADDYELVNQYTWHASGGGYAAAYVGGGRKSRVMAFMHRLIAETPDGMVTDHIDGDRLNNRRSNLRICNQSDNCANTKRRAGGHSAFKGVTWFTTKRHKKGYWKAAISGKHIGYFDTEEAAARGYDYHARKRFGEFARLNFPDEVAA